MWLFLIGSKDYTDRLGYAVATCPDCGKRGIFTVTQQRKKFTLYLVPTFQYAKKQFMSCPSCGEYFEVASELKKELEARLISQEELTDRVKRGKLNDLLGTKRKRRKNKVTA